jgi:hypothetical protein
MGYSARKSFPWATNPRRKDFHIATKTRNDKVNKKKVTIKHNLCKCPTCQVVTHLHEDYELFNVVPEDEDSIFSSPTGKLSDGQTYVLLTQIREIVSQELRAAGVLIKPEK